MGNIWFELGEHTFPEKNWYDFAETITGWWVAALIELYRSNGKWHEKSLLFMDGPCEAVLRNGSPVTIHFKHHGAVEKSFPIELAHLAHSILTSRRNLLQHAVSVGWKQSAHADLELCDWLSTLIMQTPDKAKRPVN